jgi:hypothetical protein
MGGMGTVTGREVLKKKKTTRLVVFCVSSVVACCRRERGGRESQGVGKQHGVSSSL